MKSGMILTCLLIATYTVISVIFCLDIKMVHLKVLCYSYS